MTRRVGEWMGMLGKRRFWPLDPVPEDVHTDDIARALSMICRFGGRCRRFYSVAQHSVFVARLLPPELKLHGLMHDAAEAYLGDVIRPLKSALYVCRDNTIESFAMTECRVHSAIAEHFDLRELSDEEERLIKEADDLALATEARDLMGGARWPGLPTPLDVPIQPVGPETAYEMFMRTMRQCPREQRTTYGRRAGQPVDPKETG